MVAEPSLRRSDERGETLIELLVAMLILGTTVVAIVGGLGTSIVVSDLHRKETTAGAELRTYAEAIEGGLAAAPTSYVACARPEAYAAPPGFESVDGYTATVTAVSYWEADGSDRAAFSPECLRDSGVQALTLQVSTDSGQQTTETLELVIRSPCRPTDRRCG